MKYFVVTSCYLSGWIEAKFICNLTPKAITRFLWKDIICRHCCFRNLVVDGKSKNKNAVQKLALWYGIKKMVVSAYHLEANRMIKQGHKRIVDALAKMSEGSLTNKVQNFPAILLADRSTDQTSTWLTPNYLNCGNEIVLPIELGILIWRILLLNEVHSASELLAMQVE